MLVEEPSGAGGGEFLAVGVFGDEVGAAGGITREGVFGEVGKGLGGCGKVGADEGFCGGFGSPLGGVFFAGGEYADGDVFYTAGGGVVETEATPRAVRSPVTTPPWDRARSPYLTWRERWSQLLPEAWPLE